MSEELKVQCTREQWQKIDAALIAKLGGPAVMYAIQDAQRDIAALHRRIDQLASAAVVVPRELLERTLDRLLHGHERDKAVRELRAILNHAGGE